jgi:hypothetical protein
MRVLGGGVVSYERGTPVGERGSCACTALAGVLLTAVRKAKYSQGLQRYLAHKNPLPCRILQSGYA